MMKSSTRVSSDLALPHGAKVKENEEVHGNGDKEHNNATIASLGLLPINDFCVLLKWTVTFVV